MLLRPSLEHIPILLTITLLIIAGGIFFLIKKENQPAREITNFNECTEAGNPIMESYPRRCNGDGKSFTEDIGNELEKMDLIRIEYPRPNSEVESPLAVRGQARGNWYFEASFPVQLYDQKGNLLATGIAQAQDDWMTEEFVEFKADVVFNKPEGNSGTLILKKDNPSGLSEYDDFLEVPVLFE